MEAYNWRMIDLTIIGRVDEADRDREICTSLREELRSPNLMCFPPLYASFRALMNGEFDEAEKLSQRAMRTGAETGSTWAVGFGALQIFFLRWEQGRIAESDSTMRRAAEQEDDHPARVHRGR